MTGQMLPDTPILWVTLTHIAMLSVCAAVIAPIDDKRRMHIASSAACGLVLIVVVPLLSDFAARLTPIGAPRGPIGPILVLPATFIVFYLALRIAAPKAQSQSIAYVGLHAMVLSFFSSSLAWQVFYTYFSTSGLFERVAYPWTLIYGAVGLVFPFILIGGFVWWERSRKTPRLLSVERGELAIAAMLAVTALCAGTFNPFSPSALLLPSTSELAFLVRTLAFALGAGALYAFDVELRNRRAAVEIASIRHVLDLQHMQYQRSKEAIDTLNATYHDFKHHLLAMRNLTSDEEREKELDEIASKISVYEEEFRTGNPVVDTLLRAKSIEAKRSNINFTCVADGAVCAHMSVLDLSALLGNVLDNALEAERKISEESLRNVHVKIGRVNGFGVLEVENWVGKANIVFGADGLPHSTKDNPERHGYGLKSVRHIIERYEGSMTVGVESGWFRLRVLIPLPTH